MCDPTSLFWMWMNWRVQALVAFATVAAVVVALFGERIRLKIWPPELSLSLTEPHGDRTPVSVISTDENGVQHERVEDARYYRLWLSNGRRWSPANQVQVVLLRIEQPSSDGGRFITTWTGDVPLTWTNQPLYGLLRTIGPPAQIDLCTVVKGKWLELHPLLQPNNLTRQYRQPTKLILSIQAKSNEVDSPVLRIQVSWDSQWHDGAQEMAQHLVVKVLDQDEGNRS